MYMYCKGALLMIETQQRGAWWVTKTMHQPERVIRVATAGLSRLP